MKQAIFLSVILLMANLHGVFASAVKTNGDAAVNESPQYVRVNIDRVVIDIDGLAIALGKLANSIDQLALAIQQLSTNSEALSAEERRILLKAVQSVDKAGLALARLAEELPQTAENLSDRLPKAIEEARQPIADLSGGLQSARDGIFAITESLPQATDNAKQLVNSALDSALVKLSTYSIILIFTLALAFIGVMWFIYRQFLDPLAKKLDSLVGAPEHFAAMSRHMKETSENLLALQTAPAVPAEPQGDESSPDINVYAQSSRADSSSSKPDEQP